jgi:hypothetical protein
VDYEKFTKNICAVASLTGCGPSYYYKYSPPKASKGINCVQSCNGARNQCRQVAELELRNERELDLANQRNYQSCAAGRSKKDVKKYCSYNSGGFDNYGSNQFPYPSCEDDFNQCFEICGGTIEKIQERT